MAASFGAVIAEFMLPERNELRQVARAHIARLRHRAEDTPGGRDIALSVSLVVTPAWPSCGDRGLSMRAAGGPQDFRVIGTSTPTGRFPRSFRVGRAPSRPRSPGLKRAHLSPPSPTPPDCPDATCQALRADQQRDAEAGAARVTPLGKRGLSANARCVAFRRALRGRVVISRSIG